MNLTDIAILSIAEGVADVWPIDATGHTLLVAGLLGWRAGTIGVAVHLGTALALLAFLWRDVIFISQGLWKLRKMRVEPGTRLLAKAVTVAFPWVAMQIFWGPPLTAKPADLLLVGITTILCAFLMGAADRMCMTVKRIEHMGAVVALVLGVTQLAAYLSGVGRIAAGLTAARIMGFERPAAYRFLLLANALILLAVGSNDALQAILHEGLHPGSGDLIAGGVSFALVLVATGVGLAWTNRMGLLPFAVYRFILGLIMVGLALI